MANDIGGIAVAVITLNGIQVLSARLNFPWRGVWSAEVEFEADVAPAVQAIASVATPVSLLVGETPLLGIVAPTGSGTFGTRAVFRVLGGRGGWAKVLPAQHFTNPAGALLSTVVGLATGGLVGEVVTDVVPQVLGEHYARAKGPASDIFTGRDWHVDPLTSVTLAGAPWPPLPLDPTALLQNYEPYEGRAVIATDSVLLPGTTIVDIDGRLNGQTLIVRDVEQVFSADSSVANAWCSASPTSRLADAFAAATKAFAGTRYLKTYRYRFVLPASGTSLMLQAVSGDAPDLNPIEQWTGLSGCTARLAPGTEIMVGFAEGDARYPYLVSFSPLATPLEIDLGPLPFPLAFAAPTVTAFAALATYVAALTANLAANPAAYPAFAAAMAGPGAALATAIAAATPTIPTVIVKGT